jgi:hypothetical protein
MNSQPGLPDPARSGERDQPDVIAAEKAADLPDLPLAPDEAGELDREIAGAACRVGVTGRWTAARSGGSLERRTLRGREVQRLDEQGEGRAAGALADAALEVADGPWR